MKFFQTKTKEVDSRLNKKFKFFIVLLFVVAAIFGYKQIYALAQYVLDTFDTDTNIAATWRADVATTTGIIAIAEKEAINCTIWNCAASTTCSNTAGDGTYIIVKQSDEENKQWKTSATACDRPQCPNNGSQDMDGLWPDNTIDFTIYPARDACKAIGGRLPTYNELACMYTNKATFGNFVDDDYWTSMEQSPTAYAWVKSLANGAVNGRNKTDSRKVRCVMGW